MVPGEPKRSASLRHHCMPVLQASQRHNKLARNARQPLNTAVSHGVLTHDASSDSKWNNANDISNKPGGLLSAMQRVVLGAQATGRATQLLEIGLSRSQVMQMQHEIGRQQAQLRLIGLEQQLIDVRIVTQYIPGGNAHRNYRQMGLRPHLFDMAIRRRTEQRVTKAGGRNGDDVHVCLRPLTRRPA